MTDRLAFDVLIFIGAGLVVAVAGFRLTGVAKSIAAATGLGQAVLGGVLIGAVTSMAGTVASAKAAADGYAEIAFGNAIGGIAAQTAFLAVADMFYRRVNLEHAAAAEVNLTQAAALILILAIALLIMTMPEISFFGVHPGSFVLVASYLFCVVLIARSHSLPMWQPKQTAATIKELPAAVTRCDLPLRVWLAFILLVSIVATMGWLVARTAPTIAAGTGISDSVVGVLFTSISTSMPELVVAVSAVRRGAINLAIGDILGGNSFDVLFLTASDVAYRAGSIYHAVSNVQVVWVVLCVLMTAVLLLGLLRRQERGFANIGFESSAIAVIYVGAVVMLFTSTG